MDQSPSTVSSPSTQTNDSASEEALTLLKMSCAFRTKYAERDADNQVVITKRQIFQQSVHPQNRGGIHPQGMRVKDLCQKILTRSMGWDQAEVEFNGCVVREVPEDQRPKGYETFHAFTVKNCEGSELLFPVQEHVQIGFGSLAHGHITFVLKGCWCGARFEVEGISITYGPRKGCIDTDLWKVSFPRMHQAAVEGLPSETLGWRIHTEEPQAPGIISRALNEKNRLGMLPTELECLATLNFEIDLAVAERLATQVSFESVKTNLRKQLGGMVDDPTFVDVFKYVLELGRGKVAPFFPYLKNWYGMYINPTKRKVRLDNFKQMSELSVDEAWPKVAFIVWAYCAIPAKDAAREGGGLGKLVPEAFMQLAHEVRRPINLMLCFWHGPMQDHMSSKAGFATRDLLQWMSNIDFAVCDSVVNGISDRPARCKTTESVEAAVGMAVSPIMAHYKELFNTYEDKQALIESIPSPPFAIREPPSTMTKGKGKGTVKGKSAASAASPEGNKAEPTELLASVPTFTINEDGTLGVENHVHDSVDKPKQLGEAHFVKTAAPLEWMRKDIVKNSCDAASDLGLIQMTLGMIHKELTHHHEAAMKTVECMGTPPEEPNINPGRKTTKHLQATTDIKTGGLILWGVPGGAAGLQRYDQQVQENHPRTAWAKYEVKHTKEPTRTIAYQVSSQWNELKFDDTVVDCRSFDGNEKMHLYWMVRRVTPSMLEKDRKQKHKRDPIKVNMELKTHEFYHATTSILPGSGSLAHTVVVTAPFLTNTVDLKQGDVLVMEVPDAPEKEDGTRKARARTWETDAVTKAKKLQKQASKHAIDDPICGFSSENGNVYI